MKAVIKWIISFIVLHNLLADLKDQLNEICEDEIPDPPPLLADNDEEEEDGTRGHLRPITLAYFA
jgi:hypothetical protein